jgi:hypothetical protein
MAGVEPDAARSLLEAHGGQVRAAVKAVISPPSSGSREGSTG